MGRYSSFYIFGKQEIIFEEINMYLVLIFAIIVGVLNGFQQMSIIKNKNIQHKDPKNIIDFVLNGQNK